MTLAAIVQLLIALLPDFEELSTDLQTVVPIVKKVIAGQEPTQTDIEALSALEASLNAQDVADESTAAAAVSASA